METEFFVRIENVYCNEMALVLMKEILKRAVSEGYTVPAFNVFDYETLLAVAEAAEMSSSPVIIQMSMGARKHVSKPDVFVRLMKDVAENTNAPIALNHDHCTSPDNARQAIDLGFSGVMFDGSGLSFEDNIKRTREIVTYAGPDVAVEAEFGMLPGFEDRVFSEHALFTDPDQAKEFVESSGCFSLAVSVGTSHGGVVAEAPLTLHMDILRRIHESLPGFPLVLHGAASLPVFLIDLVNEQGGKVEYLKNCSEDDISKVGAFGVAKANMDVDNFLCFTREVRRILREKAEKYDPRLYLRPAREAFRDEVCHKMKNVVLSAGKSWL